MADDFSWVDKKEEEIKKERAEGYFQIEEGSQQFVLLTHCAPLPQVWDGKKYRVAEEGDKNVSIKGLCWVLQDGKIKQAKLPYTVVKEILGLQQNPEWEFALPFLHTFTLKAKGARTKEVEYSINASPKKVDVSPEILAELKTKQTPEEIVDRIKGKVSQGNTQEDTREAPVEDINPDDIPS
jgi:hypothetical protein